MADQLKNSNRKRALKCEQKPVAKRQKQDKRKEFINDEAEGPITNICPELIDRIFDFLNFESLVNVAGTCKRLQIAAVAKFGRKFQSKIICFNQNSRKPEGITAKFGSVEVCGLRYSLPLLRCFGAKISKVQVLNADKIVHKGDKHLDRYINQYCADSLIQLYFSFRTFSVNNFPKQMKKVIVLSVHNGDLGKQLPNFVKSFPNLHHLDLRMTDKFTNGRGPAVFFPNVSHLQLGLTNKPGSFNLKCATKFLHAYPQLKELDLDFILDCENDLGQLLNMLSKNRSLSKLKIMGKITGVTAAVLDRFMKEHPSFEELALLNTSITGDDAVILSRHLHSLKTIRLTFKRSYDCDVLLSQLDNHWRHSISSTKLVIVLRNRIQ